MTHIMKNYGLKLKKIMPVYFIIFFITELGTCLLRWLIEIQFNYYELNELIWICVVPTSLSFIPLFIWLRPKLDILKIKYKPASRRITRS